MSAFKAEMTFCNANKAGADGANTVYFAPTKPEGVSDGNWIQTDPKKGWFTILRLYSPLEPDHSNVRYWHT
jgi:hypothetical protein